MAAAAPSAAASAAASNWGVADDIGMLLANPSSAAAAYPRSSHAASASAARSQVLSLGASAAAQPIRDGATAGRATETPSSVADSHRSNTNPPNAFLPESTQRCVLTKPDGDVGWGEGAFLVYTRSTCGSACFSPLLLRCRRAGRQWPNTLHTRTTITMRPTNASPFCTLAWYKSPTARKSGAITRDLDRRHLHQPGCLGKNDSWSNAHSWPHPAFSLQLFLPSTRHAS